MLCGYCNTPNDDQYGFCVNCGKKMSAAISPREEPAPATVRSIPIPISTTATPPEISEPTVFVPPIIRQPVYVPPPTPKARGPWLKILVIGTIFVVLVGVIGVGAAGFWYWQRTTSEVLPDHLGFFAQSPDRNRLDELKKIDVANAIEGRDSILKNDSIPALDSNPTVILYSDGKDVPISDLRLIQLDTIKEDGSFKQIEFQAAPIEGKPEMKRIRIPDGVANGKYAFVLIDGYLNEGKHKLWPFQVRSSGKTDNGTALRAVTVSLKPTPTPTPVVKTPTPTPNVVPPPTGGTVAHCTTSNLVFRNGPSQDAYKLGNLRLGQKVYILRYSQNTEVFNGIESAFAYIQTESGQTGWVFAAYLR